MRLYDNLVDLDQQKMRSMSDQTERFKLADGERDIPIILLRQPTEGIFCTPAFKRHWLPEGAAEKGAIIPCAECAGGQCCLCSARESLLERGMYDQAPKVVKKALDGSVSHDVQVMDLRAHSIALNDLRAAVRGAPSRENVWAHPPAATALLRVQQALLTEPVKMWSFSRTVYNLVMTEIYGFQNREGTFRDPSAPWAAAVVWVSKVRTGSKTTATYSLRVDWEFQVVLPEEMFDPTPEGTIGLNALVKRYEELHRESQLAVGYWPEHRVLEALMQRGINLESGLHAAERAIAGDGPPQLPPAAMPGSVAPEVRTVAPSRIVAPTVVAATPKADRVDTVIGPPPAYARPLKPVALPQEAKPTTTSAANLDCFGTTPSLAAPTCVKCSRLSECIQVAQDRIMRPLAPSKAELPEAPTATAVLPKKTSKIVKAAAKQVEEAFSSDDEDDDVPF